MDIWDRERGVELWLIVWSLNCVACEGFLRVIRSEFYMNVWSQIDYFQSMCPLHNVYDAVCRGGLWACIALDVFVLCCRYGETHASVLNPSTCVLEGWFVTLPVIWFPYKELRHCSSSVSDGCNGCIISVLFQIWIKVDITWWNYCCLHWQLVSHHGASNCPGRQSMLEISRAHLWYSSARLLVQVQIDPRLRRCK